MEHIHNLSAESEILPKGQKIRRPLDQLSESSSQSRSSSNQSIFHNFGAFLNSDHDDNSFNDPHMLSERSHSDTNVNVS